MFADIVLSRLALGIFHETRASRMPQTQSEAEHPLRATESEARATFKELRRD